MVDRAVPRYNLRMRCRLCRAPAGFLRRRCRTCRALWRLYRDNRGAPLQVLLALFADAGASEAQVRSFLQADPDGAGVIEDRIAADMANQLFAALGSTGRQTPEQVRRLRARGAWKSYGDRPE
jgi:hypothetical protein